MTSGVVFRCVSSATAVVLAALVPFATPHRAGAASTVRVRIGTYNVSENTADGQIENGTKIAPWNNRVPGVVHYIAESGASIVGVQEAAGFVGPQCSFRQVGTRQVDDMVRRLGSNWTVAHTEVRPCLPGWKRTGVYIIYRHDVWSAGGAGQWNVGTSAMPRYGVYQLLTQRATGARLLFVSTHLLAGSGTSYDEARETETRHLISDATRYASAHGGLPILYAGDYNSHELHHPDGPAVAMKMAHSRDTLLVATSVSNRKYDSANNFMRRPPAFGHSIDHIYVSPGVGVPAWREWLDLSAGAFRGVIPSDHNLVTADVTVPR